MFLKSQKKFENVLVPKELLTCNLRNFYHASDNEEIHLNNTIEQLKTIVSTILACMQKCC